MANCLKNSPIFVRKEANGFSTNSVSNIVAFRELAKASIVRLDTISLPRGTAPGDFDSDVRFFKRHLGLVLPQVVSKRPSASFSLRHGEE